MKRTGFFRRAGSVTIVPVKQRQRTRRLGRLGPGRHVAQQRAQTVDVVDDGLLADAGIISQEFVDLLAISGHISIPGLARYDFLFLSAIAIQIVLVAVRLENWREVAVLSLFHLIGMGLELFKTSPSVRSWSYPEPAFFHLKTVPLYSGFMYASVASYIMQAWRLMRLKITQFPHFGLAVGLCAAIYANFFTNHYMLDLRWPLAACVLLLFRRTQVHFTVTTTQRRMPEVNSSTRSRPPGGNSAF